jgi:hypothetical protein
MKASRLLLSLLACVSLTSSTALLAESPSNDGDQSEPLLKERIHVDELIEQARKRGIGVQPFVVQLEAIEDKVFAGATEAELRSTVTELTRKLEDQLRQSVELKSYRPAPLTEAQRKATAEWKQEAQRKEEDRRYSIGSKEEKYRTVSRSSNTNSGYALGTSATDRRSKSEKALQVSNYDPIKATNFKVNVQAPIRKDSFSAETDPKLIHTSGVHVPGTRRRIGGF